MRLVDAVGFSDSRETRRSLAAIWGLVELREGLIQKGDDQSLLESVNMRIAGFLNQYARVLGGDYEAAMSFSSLGYMDDPTRVLQVMNMDPKDDKTTFGRDVEADLVPTVGVTGLIRAGKGTVGAILTQRYEGLHTPFVEALIAYSLAMGYEPNTNRSAKREVNDEIKPRFGNATFALASIRRAQRLATGRLTYILSFDGLRSVEEAQLFLDRPRRRLVAIEASLETRYARAFENTEEKKGEQPKSFDEFKVDSEFEERHMMGPAMALAHVRFQNNGTSAELERQIVEYFDPLMGRN